MKPATVTISVTLHALALVAATAAPSWAQDPPPAGGEEGAGAGAPPGVTVVQVPAPTYPGSLPPAGFDPDAHLGSSSRSTTDITRGDSFDLNRGGGGPSSFKGSAGGSYVVEGQSVPDGHTVRRGDTLWEISGRYYQNPYQWPKLWSVNPQIQNPHWIYPGDRVRLRDGSGGSTIGSIGQLKSRTAVPPQTIFLRETGWVDDRNDDVWGELIGAPDDKMLLSDGDEVYIQLGDKHEVQIGDELTLFRPIRTVETENTKGELVSIRGSVRIDRYNPKTRMVRARVTEALDVIERGVKVGPVGRKFDVVPPVTSEQDIDANIIASLYPNQVYVQHQVVFLDKGEKEGVKPGQRFFAIRRGDRWVQNIKGAGTMALVRPRVEDDRFAKVDTLKFGVDNDLLPDETYAELRVLRTRDHTSAALV
ncbi:MAG: LysM peptidoglycan-binding domain-containing protein, partial [Byssovorax sp.]